VRPDKSQTGGRPWASPVRITSPDGTVRVERAMTYRERRNFHTTGSTERRKGIDPGLRAQVYKRDEYRCVYCGSEIGPLQLDHIRPYSKGGRDTASNLVTSCRNCNQSKGNAWNGIDRTTP
jgi:5-methylcytosine-specific restriction endonuclease McrA